MISFVTFEDMNIKINRPEEIANRDEDICNRAHELLKGVKEEDSWTEEMDELFKEYNIEYEIADEEEFKEFMKKANLVEIKGGSMEESSRNVVRVCPHHNPDIQKETLKQMKELDVKIKKGDSIKTAFKKEKYIEYMWIVVTGMLGDKVIGKLQNQPQYPVGVKYNDVVTVDINTISGYLSKDKKIEINPLKVIIKEQREKNGTDE